MECACLLNNARKSSLSDFDILGFSTGQNFNIAGDMKHYGVTKACSGTENLNH